MYDITYTQIISKRPNVKVGKIGLIKETEQYRRNIYNTNSSFTTAVVQVWIRHMLRWFSKQFSGNFLKRSWEYYIQVSSARSLPDSHRD
jgi:hypothetical protein